VWREVRVAAALAAALGAALSAGIPTAHAALPKPEPAAPGARWPGSDRAVDEAALALDKEIAAGGPLGLARLYHAYNLAAFTDRVDRLAPALARAAQAPKADPLTRAHAVFLRDRRAFQEGRLDEVAADRAQLGLLSTGMLIGPFDNSAGRGHDEAYPPESASPLLLDAPVPGKGHPVSWRSIDGLAPWGVIRASALIHPAADATVYLLVAVEAERATQAVLRTGSTDRLKVFLDRKPVLGIDVERRAELDQDATLLDLPAGPSTLMFKVSWSGKRGELFARLTGLDGKPLAGVKTSGDPVAIARALAAPKLRPTAKPARGPLPKPAGVLDAIDRAVAQSGGGAKTRAEMFALRSDLEAMLALYDKKKLPTPPERDLEQAIQLDPANPDYRFFYAHRVERPGDAREQLEAALASDPGHVPSLYKLAAIARESDRRLEARSLLETAIQKDPGFDAARVDLNALRFESRFERELSVSALEQGPRAKSSPTILAAIARSKLSLGDRNGARAAAEAALAADATRSGAVRLLVGLDVDAGQTQHALGLVEAGIRLRPWNLAGHLKRARLLAGRDPPGLLAAEQAVAEIERLFPDSLKAKNLAAELELRSSNKAGAIAALDRSLAVDANQTELRRRRGALAGEQKELEDEFTIDAGAAQKLPVSEEEKAWGAAYLADRTVVRLYGNGQAARFHQSVLRLDKPDLRDSVRTERIRYTPGREVVEVLSAERIRPSGEIVRASRISDNGPTGKVGGMYVDTRWKTVTFDDVDAGDLVHLRYRVDSVGQNIFGGFFGDTEGIQAGFPKYNVMYMAIAPEGRPLYPGMVHTASPAVSVENGLVKTSWSIAHVPALDVEPMSPPYAELGSMVSVSTYKNWNDLGRWYADLVKEQLELDDAARTAGREAASGAKSELEKIQRLYDFVVKNTRYVGIELGIHGWKPFKASEVLRRRYGDCKDKATLLTALLLDNGIEADVALVRTADRGESPPGHATMWAFNHAITYVPKYKLFLDGTAEYSGSSELPYQDQGAMVLVVHKDGTTALMSPPESGADDNENRSNYTALVGPDGALDIEGTERFRGARASAVRQEFEEEKTRKTQLEKTLNQVFPGARVNKLEFSDLSNLEAPVSYTYSANIARYGIAEGSRMVLPLTLFPHQVANAYGTLAKREHDLYTSYAWSTRNVIRYRLPKGARIEALPEGVTLDTPYISLQQVVRAVDGGFETDDTVTLKKRRVPVEAYAAFREACLSIDRALERKLVIKR
jgi:hypothetical protein